MLTQYQECAALVICQQTKRYQVNADTLLQFQNKLCAMILIFSPKTCHISRFHITMNHLVFCRCYYLELHSGMLSVTPCSSQNGADTDILDRYNQN